MKLARYLRGEKGRYEPLEFFEDILLTYFIEKFYGSDVHPTKNACFPSQRELG